jgi:hypothetical protein
METKKKFVYSYQMMIVFALMCGVLSLAIQFLEGYEALVLVLAASGIAGLVGGGKGKAASEPQLLEKSFKTSIEWLLLILVFAFAFLMTSNIFHVLIGVNNFINAHWPGLMLSVMCIVLAISGLKKTNQPQAV